MVEFILKESDSRYNLTFMKSVHKRNGEIVQEPGDTLYGVTLDVVTARLAHENVCSREKNLSLKEYLVEFYKSYNEICKSLKKTL